MVLRAAASSVSKKLSARGKTKRAGAESSDTASVTSSRSVLSNSSAGSMASLASVASSHASVSSRASSLASSISSSISSLTRSTKSKNAKRGPALDSGPRPRQHTELEDLPEDEPGAADTAEVDMLSSSQDALAHEHAGTAVAGGAGTGAAMTDSSTAATAENSIKHTPKHTPRTVGLGAPVFGKGASAAGHTSGINTGLRTDGLSHSNPLLLGKLQGLANIRPLESVALAPAAVSEDLDDDEEFDYFVPTNVATPRSVDSKKSSSSSRRQQSAVSQLPLPHTAGPTAHGDCSSEHAPPPRDNRTAPDARTLLTHTWQTHSNRKQASTTPEQHQNNTNDAAQGATYTPLQSGVSTVSDSSEEGERRERQRKTQIALLTQQTLELAGHRNQEQAYTAPRTATHTATHTAILSRHSKQEQAHERDNAQGRVAPQCARQGECTVVGEVGVGSGSGMGVGSLYPDPHLRLGADGRNVSNTDRSASVCGESESGFSVLDDVMTQYTESEQGSGTDDAEEAEILKSRLAARSTMYNDDGADL